MQLLYGELMYEPYNFWVLHNYPKIRKQSQWQSQLQ